MDEALVNQVVLLMFAGALLGACIGWGASLVLRRVHRHDVFMQGMAIGLLIFGICTSIGAVRLGVAAWQFEDGTVEATGRLVGYEQTVATDARGGRTTSLAPRVAYEAADGQGYTLLGLGGSQKNREEGDAVPVRYRVAAPQHAVVDDFQNRWGAFWAISGFAGFGLLAGTFFAVSALSDGRTRLSRPRRTGPGVQILGRLLNAAAGLTLVASVVAPALVQLQDMQRSLAVTFGGVAASTLLWAGSLWTSPQSDRGQSLMILLILAAGFGFFAFGLWRLG